MDGNNTRSVLLSAPRLLSVAAQLLLLPSLLLLLEKLATGRFTKHGCIRHASPSSKRVHGPSRAARVRPRTCQPIHEACKEARILAPRRAEDCLGACGGMACDRVLVVLVHAS
jgi:hypothetical protein